MIITLIEESKTKPVMSKVYIDDMLSFCLPQKRISTLNLGEGQDLPAETLEYILKYEVYDAAKSAAVNYMALKLRTSCETRQKLAELGYQEDTIGKVIENLIEIDYINDFRYAVKYISEKTKLHPKSSKMLSMELRHKGISDDIIGNALEEIEPDDDGIALELLRKRYSKYTSFDEKLINKMRTFLLGRGFSYSQVSKSISRFLPEE